MADHGQWRGAFFALGAIGVLYAMPYFAFLRRVDEPKPERNNTTPGFAISDLIRVPMFVLQCVVFPVFVFGLWLLYGWLPAFLHDKFALTQADAAFNATVFVQTATFIGVITGGVLADKLHARIPAARFWLLVAGLLLSAPCIHVLGSAETLTTTRIAATLFGLSSGLFIGNIFPSAFDVVPASSRATAVGLLNFFGAIMSGFATLFGGWWKQSLGIDRLLTFTAIGYLAAGIAVVMGIKMLLSRDQVRAQSFD
jgi:predicted MFS family arabinose efflux permease